jgi:hypothetical protein
MRAFRSHLTYANVIATIALMLALGGTSYAAFKLPKNSVKSTNIKNHEVKSQDLATNAVSVSKIKNAAVTTLKIANGAVTTGQLADNSVTTSKVLDAAITHSKLDLASVQTNNLADNAVTGDKTNESTLGNFGCGGDFETGGLCAFRTDAPSAVTWLQAVERCRAARPAALLPTMGQIQDVSNQPNSPFTSMTVWTAEAAGGNTNPAAQVVGVSSTNVTSANPVAISNNTSITQVACVYDPASKAG